MPLPPSAIPSYQPRSFVTPQSERATTKAMELFFRYHPAVFKMKTFEMLMKDEQFQAQADAEKRKMLAEEMQQINGLLARYRSVGAGPSGVGELAARFGAGTAGGRGGRGGGGLRRGGLGGEDDFLIGMSRNENDRFKVIQDGRAEELRRLDKLDEIPRPLSQFKAEFLGDYDRDKDAGRMSGAALTELLSIAFLDAQERFGSSVANEPPFVRKNAATDFYYDLRRRRPDLLPAVGPDGRELNPEAVELIEMIDNMYQTGGFVLQSFQGGREPNQALDVEKKLAYDAAVGATSVGPGVFEARAQELLGTFSPQEIDTNGDGTVSPAEQSAAMKKAMSQARAELGVADPLSDEEALMLSRYTQALSDDGVATPEELGADFNAAKAAYDRGRMVQTLPRGAEAYYDDTYLDLLRRRSQVQAGLSETDSREGTGMQRAARRAERLPEVTREAYDAAAAISPLAAESLPYALRRFTDAGGAIEPQSAVERKAQRLIEADPARRPTFTDFTQQINKMFPDDVEARREAFAYYGAYFNAIDTRGTTLSDAKLRGDVQAAAKEMEKAKASPPSPPPAPPPLPPPANEPVPPPTLVQPEEMMEFYTQAPELGLTPPVQPAMPIDDYDPGLEVRLRAPGPYPTSAPRITEEERKLDEERELFLQMLESDIEERRRNGR
jgi:hypothetical protein